jgi:hypothetical protein
VNHRSPPKISGFAGKTGSYDSLVNDSEPFSDIFHPAQPHERGESGKRFTSFTSFTAPPRGDDYEGQALTALRHGNGPSKALETFRANATPFEQVVRAVMHYCGRGKDDFDTWEHAVIGALKALEREEE